MPGLAVEVVTEGLEHGWDIGFLPGGQVLVTERPGRISLVSGLREGAQAHARCGPTSTTCTRRARAA